MIKDYLNVLAYLPVPPKTLYMRGEEIYGGPGPTSFYLVITGAVMVTGLTQWGRECGLDVYGPREVFGESCLSLDGSTENLNDIAESAVALERTLVMSWPPGVIYHHLGRDPEFMKRVVKFLANRVKALSKRQESRVDLSHTRLAQVLLRLAESIGTKRQDGSVELPVLFSHEKLAVLVGTTRARITYFMNRFEEQGLVQYHGYGKITLNRKKIQEFLELEPTEPKRMAAGQKQ